MKSFFGSGNDALVSEGEKKNNRLLERKNNLLQWVDLMLPGRLSFPGRLIKVEKSDKKIMIASTRRL
jgi:hypothetical protein